jgi:hypothetical protein
LGTVPLPHRGSVLSLQRPLDFGGCLSGHDVPLSVNGVFLRTQVSSAGGGGEGELPYWVELQDGAAKTAASEGVTPPLQKT